MDSAFASPAAPENAASTPSASTPSIEPSPGVSPSSDPTPVVVSEELIPGEPVSAEPGPDPYGSGEVSILDSLESDLLAVEQAIAQLDQMWGSGEAQQSGVSAQQNAEAIVGVIKNAVPEDRFPAAPEVI